MARSSAADFKEYCLQFYRELNHPYLPNEKLAVNIGDLETCLDIFDGILSIECHEQSLRGLREQFYSAFGRYLDSPRNEIGLLCNSVDKLSALIDPFLKKVALHFMPNKKFKTPDGKLVPLWKTSKYVVVLEALDIIKGSEIVKKSPSYWARKSTDLALLREGFTARQKGVHESRVHNLEGLEKEVYGIIGTYIVVCLKLCKTLAVIQSFEKIVEKRRAVYLFEERLRSYPITSSFFSRKEYLLIYRYRSAIDPDVEGKKFLILNYLAGKGPCFYWFKRKDKPIMVEWAKKYLGESKDEIIRKNAIRFLTQNSTITPRLNTFLRALPYYEEKEELARYMGKFARPSDRNKLLRLCTDKREEVAHVSRKLISKMFPKIDEPFRQIARSKSAAKRLLVRLIIRNFADQKHLDEYRSFAKIKDQGEQIIYIYCLGEVGTEEDLKVLSNWITSRRRNESVRIASWYSISRIAGRMGDCQLVWSVINKKDQTIKIAGLEALTRSAIGPNFESLFSKGFVERFGLSDIILQIATERDREVIRSYLAKATLDYGVRDLVLCLCRIGGSKDFEFLLNLFSRHKPKIEFQNHVKVADAMARICSERKSSSLKKYINCKEFWSYILPEQRRPKKKRLPVENIDNQAFMRRLIAASFIEKAGRGDIGLIQKLLRHYYKWIGYKAATKFSQIGVSRDLDVLNETLWNLGEDELKYAEPALHALCLLDEQLHKLA